MLALLGLVHDEGHGDDRVGDKDAEVLADHGVAGNLGARLGGHDKHGVEEDDAEEDIADGGLVHARAADQQRRDAEHADLRVGAVGRDIAHVLEVDDHAEAREHRGHDDGDDAGALDIDARVTRDVHVLPHRAHVLAELGLSKPHDEHAQHADDHEGQHRDLHAAHAHGQQVIQALAHVEQRHRVADAVAAGKLYREVLDGDDGAHHVQHHQLVNAVHEEADDVGGDHLAALGHVEDLTAEGAEQDGDGDGEDHRQHDAGDAPNLPVGDQDQRDLARHGAEGHAEVQTHAGHDGDQQREDQEDVAPHAGDDLVNQIAVGETGDGDAHRADDDEHDRHGVVAEEGENLIVFFHFVASVFLVSA